MHKFSIVLCALHIFALLAALLLLPGAGVGSAVAAADDATPTAAEQRRKRALIFPRTAPTRIQWIIGIGIPLEDLVFEAMTTGYVLKAEYFLPYDAKQLRTKATLNIKGREGDADVESNFVDFAGYSEANMAGNWTERLRLSIDASKRVLSSYRWALYKGLEHIAIRMGLQGRVCVLKSLCEAAEVRLHYGNGLFGELLHILLTPSTSADELSEHADNEYFHAEFLGRSGADCQRVFVGCPRSLLAQFSDVHTLSEDFGRLIGLSDFLKAI